MGHTQIDLLCRGARAQGSIVAYQTVASHDRESHHSSAHALVEFSVGDRRFRFVDRLGGVDDGSVRAQVPVRYLPDNPTIAMIDRPTWNWIPWGPVAAVGMLIMLSAIVGFSGVRRRAAQHDTVSRR